MPDFKEFRGFTTSVAAFGEETINIAGTYFVALAATGAFQIALGDMAFTDFQAGLGVNLVEGDEFRKIRLKNLDGVANVIEFNAGYGSFDDNRVVLPQGLDLSKASTLGVQNDVTISTATTSLLLGGSGARRQVIVQNLPTSLGDIRVGPSSGLTASQGVYVPIGGSVVLDYTGDVYARNVGTGDALVAATNVSD